MSALSALTPPAVPKTSPAQNVMGFQMERRAQAATTLAAVREAAREDPRAMLRAAHAERDAATADIVRLTDTLARARAHRAAIAARQRAAEARARHADSAAAEGLIAAFASGASAAVAVDDDAVAKAAKLGREAEIADAAVSRLASELATAEDQARVAGWRVRALGLAVLEAHGVELAEAMLIEQENMRQRRARLGQLQSLIVVQGRSLFGDAAITPPPTISAAVAASDPPLAWQSSSLYVPRQAETPNPWSESFQALIADAEAEIEAAP